MTARSAGSASPTPARKHRQPPAIGLLDGPREPPVRPTSPQAPSRTPRRVRIQHHQRTVVAALHEPPTATTSATGTPPAYGRLTAQTVGIPSSARAPAVVHRRPLVPSRAKRGRAPRDQLGVALQPAGPSAYVDGVLPGRPRRCPPADTARRAAPAPRSRPIPGGGEGRRYGQVAHSPAGRPPAPRSCPGIAPRALPMTRSTWDVARRPASPLPVQQPGPARTGARGRKISYSADDAPAPASACCSSTTNSHRLRNTSSPKLTVPMVQGGPCSRPASSNGQPVGLGIGDRAPPEESWTIRSVESRSASTVARRAAEGPRVGWARSSRMWTCHHRPGSDPPRTPLAAVHQLRPG